MVHDATGLDEAAFLKGATDICTPEQMRRLKQISIQAAGASVLLDRRVIRSLQLSAEQEDKIDALLPVRKQVGVIAINVNGVDKVAEKAEQTWTSALEILTADQRKGWDALVGERLPTAELNKAHGHGVAGVWQNGGRIRVGAGGALPGGALPPAIVPPMPQPREN
jgi:hypothetical protein